MIREAGVGVPWTVPSKFSRPAYGRSRLYTRLVVGVLRQYRDKDDTTVGVGHSRRYCNTGYDQSQGRRPSTLKCIGSISKGDIEPNHPSEIQSEFGQQIEKWWSLPAVCAISGRPVSRTGRSASLSLIRSFTHGPDKTIVQYNFIIRVWFEL